MLRISGRHVKDWVALPAVGRLTPGVEAEAPTPTLRSKSQFGERPRRRGGGITGPGFSQGGSSAKKGGHISPDQVPGYKRTSDALAPNLGGNPGATDIVEAARATTVSEIVCRLRHTYRANC